MKIAWVVLFNYNKHANLYITGIYIDLVRICSYLQKISPDEVYISTDIEQDVDMREIIQIGRAPRDTPTIFSKIKQIGYLYPYRDIHDFIEFGKEKIFRRAEELFFYFGGHMDKEHNMLFGDDKFPALQLLALVDNYLSTSSLSVMVWDCCNTRGNFLPFSYNGIKLVHDNTALCYWHKKILLICPEEDEQIPNPRGSNFTRELFRQLKRGDRYLKNARIYSSQPNSVLPSWLYIKGKISVSLQGETLLILHNVSEENS